MEQSNKTKQTQIYANLRFSRKEYFNGEMLHVVFVSCDKLLILVTKSCCCGDDDNNKHTDKPTDRQTTIKWPREKKQKRWPTATNGTEMAKRQQWRWSCWPKAWRVCAVAAVLGPPI